MSNTKLTQQVAIHECVFVEINFQIYTSKIIRESHELEKSREEKWA